MRRPMVWPVSWLLAAILAVLLAQGIAAQDQNLLTNGGFESGTAGWAAYGGELAVSDALVRSGSYAGVFAVDSVEPRHEVTQCLPVAPAADYEFRGYAARGESDMMSTLHLAVVWHDEDGCSHPLGMPYDSPMVALEEAGGWYGLALDARSPSTARSASLRIVIKEEQATVYLDDFAVSGPPTPTETPSPSATTSPTPTAGPHFTPTAAPTAHRPASTPSATPHPSPTASSWETTPIPVGASLKNGGFEDADPDAVPAFWRKYGGELLRTSAMHLQGQFAAAFSSETSSTKWVYQTVTVQGGKAYVLSAYALKDDPAVAAAYLRLSWYASPDGSGQAIGTADSTELLADDAPQFRFLTTGAAVAPAEAASAKARLMLEPAGEAQATVYFDEVSFEETALPEPTASPAATAVPVGGQRAATPTSTAPGSPLATPAPEEVAPIEPAVSSSRPRSSPMSTALAGTRTPVALGAASTPAATSLATRVATPAAPVRQLAAVYRERRPEASIKEAAPAGEQDGGGLSAGLLGGLAAVPALAAVGTAVYYRRWRRDRLR